MAKIIVKVKQLRGETGLRLPGTLFPLDESLAAKYEAYGWISIPEKVASSSGAVIHTKELKTKRAKPAKKKVKIQTK